MDYWCDGHMITADDPDDARRETVALYGHRPEIVRQWTPADGAACERHGGPWGEDETCPACTDEDGKPLAYHARPDAQRGVRRETVALYGNPPEIVRPWGPGSVATITTTDPGAEYRVEFADGTVRVVGDAQPEYWQLAQALDAVAERGEVL